MREKYRKIISMLLLLSVLFGCVSCDEKREETLPEYDEDIRLEIESDEVSYSEEYMTAAADRIAELVTLIAKKYYGKTVPDNFKTTVKQYFYKNILLILYKVKIDEGELDLILTSAEDHVANADDGAILLPTLYSECASVLDPSRAGYLLYELSLLFVKGKLDDNKERYEKYGYKWLLSNIEHYEMLTEKVKTTLGKDKFIAAATMSMFVAESILGIGNFSGGFALSGSEVLYVLEYQGRYFSDLDISIEEWEIFAEISSELIPERTSSLISSELYALKKDGYFITASRVMPKLIHIYAALTARLREEGRLYPVSDADGAASAVCSAMDSLSGEVLSFLSEIEAFAATESKSEKDALTTSGRADEFNEFSIKIGTMSAEELLFAISEIALDSECATERLTSALTSYFMGVMPYLTFSMLN